MKFGVLVFPGSNCDCDCVYAVAEGIQQDVRLIWHQENSLNDVDAVIVPGGFSYGDYLRAGAIAQFSQITEALKIFADKGGLVLGICNGFQILLEIGLLPGAMMRNRNLSFICEDVYVKVENAATSFTNACKSGQILKLPIAHAEGNYYTDPVTLSSLQANAQIVFRYCTADGRVTSKVNPNGSMDNIAGIVNTQGNVLGLMPHPERCAESMLGNEDGLNLFRSMLTSLLATDSVAP